MSKNKSTNTSYGDIASKMKALIGKYADPKWPGRLSTYMAFKTPVGMQTLNGIVRVTWPGLVPVTGDKAADRAAIVNFWNKVTEASNGQLAINRMAQIIDTAVAKEVAKATTDATTLSKLLA